MEGYDPNDDPMGPTVRTEEETQQSEGSENGGMRKMWDAGLISKRNADISRIRAMFIPRDEPEKLPVGVASLSPTQTEGFSSEERESTSNGSLGSNGATSGAGGGGGGGGGEAEKDGRGISYCELFVDEYDGTLEFDSDGGGYFSDDTSRKKTQSSS